MNNVINGLTTRNLLKPKPCMCWKYDKHVSLNSFMFKNCAFLFGCSSTQEFRINILEMWNYSISGLETSVSYIQPSKQVPSPKQYTLPRKFESYNVIFG